MTDTHEETTDHDGFRDDEPTMNCRRLFIYGKVEARAKLWAAIAKARAEFKPIGKNVEGRKGNQTYKYTPLSAIFEGVDQALADNGVAFHQQITSDGGPITTVNTIIAGHGAEIVGELSFRRPEFGESGFSVKDYGALLTYYRRYAAQTAFGVEGDRDLDEGDSPADMTSNHTPAEPRPRQQKQQRQPRPPEMQQRQRPQQPKDAEKDQGEQKPAVSDELIGMVVSALDSIVGSEGRRSLATVADVTAAFNQTKGNPQVNDNTVAYALTLAAKRNLCASVKKGDLTVYVGQAKEGEQRGKPRTESQGMRLQELAQILWGDNPQTVKQKFARYVYTTVGIANPAELDYEGCERVLAALENEPGAKP